MLTEDRTYFGNLEEVLKRSQKGELVRLPLTKEVEIQWQEIIERLLLGKELKRAL